MHPEVNSSINQQSDPDALFPFTCTRPILDIRIGILTLREKWNHLFPEGKPAGLPDNIVPNLALAERFRQEQAVAATGLPAIPAAGTKPTGQSTAAGISNPAAGSSSSSAAPSPASLARILTGARQLTHPWHIFQHNDQALRDDFALLTKDRTSAPIPDTVQTVNPGSIFIEEGARVHHSLLNAATGPIYIGRNTEIMEGCFIRGPFALCEGAIVKMGARIYGATTIGPYSTAGGEIKNSILFGYSNKGHDGYLGDSVIGEWCNLGAGTSNSNVKNNAGDVKVWDAPTSQFISAGLKCGLLMGDYSRAAINTSFNTGTVVGVCCNVFGEGLTPKYIPHFSWGQKGDIKYVFELALQDITNWKKLKNQFLTDAEIRTLEHIFGK